MIGDKKVKNGLTQFKNPEALKNGA